MAEVRIPKKEAVREHEHLVKVLRHGDTDKLDKEAKKQSRELRHYRKLNGRKGSRR
jgi:hypothetical protein